MQREAVEKWRKQRNIQRQRRRRNYGLPKHTFVTGTHMRLKFSFIFS